MAELYKKIGFGVLLVCAVFNLAADNVWVYNTPRDLLADRISFTDSKENAFTRQCCTDVKTANEENTLALKIISKKENALPHFKQVNFRYRQAVEKDEQYKISFVYKGTAPGNISLTVAQMDAPYKAIGKYVGRELRVSKEWQTAEIKFHASDAFAPPLATPRLMIGHYPVGETLYIGPVKIEKVSSVMALSVGTKWKRVLGDAAIDAIPAGTEEIEVGENGCELSPDKKFPAKSCAVLYQNFTAASDGTMQIGMAADWWFECFVNGVKVFDTMKNGNQSNQFLPTDHVFNFPVKKGDNLIAVKVYSGSGGWRFAVGKVPFVEDPSGSKLLTIVPSAEYKAVNLDSLAVKSGSALDFSEVNGSRPDISSRGRLLCNSEGKIAFESTKEKSVRFLSFNFDIANWRQRVEDWSNQDLETFAQTAANMGYNMIRIHRPESFLLGWKIHNRPFKNMTQTGIPQTAEEIAWDPKSLDRFDYLLYCLKKHGIYINLDIMGGGSGYTTARIYDAGDSFRWSMFVDERYRNHWKAAASFLLNRENRYTKTRLKDDPILAVVNFMNEQDMVLLQKAGVAKLTAPFRKYLQEKYKTDAALSAAWEQTITFNTVGDINENILRSGKTAGRDAGKFLISTMTEMTDYYTRTIREIGYPGIVNHFDMIVRTMEIPVRSQLPAIAQHIYFAHPWHVPKEKKIATKEYPIYWGSRDKDSMCDQNSSLDSNFFRAASVARFLDRPFFITEYSHSAYNKFRHERGLFFASYAALQGWDMLTAHADMVWRKPDPITWFDSASDPIVRASEAITALIFLRKDVQESTQRVVLELDSTRLFPDNYLAAVGDDYSKLAMLTKIGILYPESKVPFPLAQVKPTLSIKPDGFSRLDVNSWWVSVDTTDSEKTADLIRQLRNNGILSAKNKTDFTDRIYQSDTEELLLDAKNKTMQVVTDRLEGAILKKNQEVNLNTLSIRNCSVPASIVVASLENRQSLQNANRLLLIISTNALNNDMIFENSSMIRCLDPGYFPILMQTVQAELHLKTAQSAKAAVYALNLDGSRAEQIPAQLSDDELVLKLNTEKLKYATPFFEIIFE
ncbi:MAG: beta-galactosidase [Victivallales bacterium]|jgi:hypothetical protein|nr:beta-galactosidase [Victivallales bacterium]